MARTRGPVAGEVLGGEEMVLEEEEACFVRHRLAAVGVVIMWLASRALEAAQKWSRPFSAPCESPKPRLVSWSTATPG